MAHCPPSAVCEQGTATANVITAFILESPADCVARISWESYPNKSGKPQAILAGSTPNQEDKARANNQSSLYFQSSLLYLPVTEPNPCLCCEKAAGRTPPNPTCNRTRDKRHGWLQNRGCAPNAGRAWGICT
ncbi:unnamed protein product [Eretmochelys imbricata]